MNLDLHYSKEELLEIGFSKVGDGVRVSRDSRFFSVQGELGNSVRIDAFSILTGRLFLGDFVHISPFCFLGGTGGGIRMESHSGISTHVGIFTKSDDYSVSGPADKIIGAVSIGEGAIIGCGSKIFPGVTVGNGAKIGGGCIVSQPIPSGTIVVSRGAGIVPIR